MNMLKKILRFLIPLFFALSVFLIQIAVSNLLPEPWSRVNLIMVMAVWFLIFQERYGKYIWLVFGLSLFTELFHSTPFGLNTVSLFFSLYFLDWFLVNVLTNRFFLIVFLAGTVGTIAYRAVYLLLIYFFGFFGGPSVVLNSDVFVSIGWETLNSSALLTLIYLVYILSAKKSSPKYISGI